MKIVVCIIARMASSRLPGKVMQEVGKCPLVENIIINLKRTRRTDTELVMCTTHLYEESPLVEIANRNKLNTVRGSVLSVSDRMLEAANQTGAGIVVRVTGDNIFTDVVFLDELIEVHIARKAEYSRVANLPNGVTAEVMNTSALRKCYEAHDKNTSEYMTLHMFDPAAFKTLVMYAEPSLARPEINLSVDTLVDLDRTLSVFSCARDPFNLSEVIKCIDQGQYPGSFIDETKTVRLIDKEMAYLEFKKYLQTLEEKSIRITCNEEWYATRVNKY